MNEDARKMWEFAINNPWINLLMMFIAVSSIIAIVWVFITYDFIDAMSTYGVVIMGGWGFYLFIILTWYQNIRNKEIQEKIWNTLTLVKKSDGWDVDISAPDNIVIRYPDGRAFFFEISDVKEGDA